MFEALKDRPVILVTGPQRSGTRFITKAICHDTGHQYVDEAAIHTDSLYALDTLISARTTPLAVQCPALCSILPGYVHRYKDYFLVMCFRHYAEILASRQRIAWQWDSLESSRYAMRTEVLPQEMLDKWPSYWIQEAVWMKDRHLVQGRFQEVYYDEMETHPLWVPKEQRIGWHFAQTEVEVTSCS